MKAIELADEWLCVDDADLIDGRIIVRNMGDVGVFYVFGGDDPPVSNPAYPLGPASEVEGTASRVWVKGPGRVEVRDGDVDN